MIRAAQKFFARGRSRRSVTLALAIAAGLGALTGISSKVALAESGAFAKDTAGDSTTLRPARLRRPTREVKAPDETSLQAVLPEFARDELLMFEEKLLEHRKAKRAGLQ